MEKNIEVSLLLDFYGELLKQSGRKVIELYYNEDLSLSEIADQIGITRQGVRDLIKRGELQLKRYEEECGWCKKIGELQKILEDDNPDIESIKKIVNQF